MGGQQQPQAGPTAGGLGGLGNAGDLMGLLGGLRQK